MMTDEELKCMPNVRHYSKVDVQVQPGGINIQHVENLYQADVLKALGVELEVKKQGERVPECESTPPVALLSTTKADALWAKAREMRWVDDSNQPLVSQPKAAIMASVMADVLQLSPRWAPFEELWGVDDLANKLARAQMCNYYSTSLREFENVFGA